MTATTKEDLHRAIKIQTQARNSLLKPDPKLDYAISNSAAHGLPEITISDLQGQYLAIQCQLLKAKSVLEIGSLGGYSTIWFARTGAKVTCLEIDPKHRDLTLEHTKGYDVDVILGPALDSLPKLAAEGREFDLIFIDADWENQWEYFQRAMKLTKKCIYVDNVLREMMEGGNYGEKESLLTKIGKLEGVDATLVPTVSGHKTQNGKPIQSAYDGFLLAVVK